ncbi:MAG: permease [Candidatus Latescibacterota bacterium]
MYYSILHFFWRFYAMADEALEGTHTRRVITTFWELFAGLWYFVLIGAVIAVTVSRFLPKQRVSDFLKERGRWAVPLCALVGVLSPMSTFSAIPIVGALMAVGVPAPPLMTFLIASPLMNPSLFIITGGALGWQMAIARTVSALIMGVTAGIAAHFLSARGYLDFSQSVRPRIASQTLFQEREKASSQETVRSRIGREFWGFLKEFRGFTAFIGKYFLFALLIASIVQTVVSPEWVLALVGVGNHYSVLTSVALGIPLYACGGGSIPIIEILVRMGMTQGAALAFFLAGPATKFSTILTLNAVVKGRVTAFYLIVMLLGAAILGYVYSMIAPELV